MTAAANIGDRQEATLVSVVFRSPTSPWGIFRFRREDGTTFEATGDFGHSVLYEEFVLYGRRVPDIEGGVFIVSKFTSSPPRSPKAISGYLSELTGASRAATVKLARDKSDLNI